MYAKDEDKLTIKKQTNPGISDWVGTRLIQNAIPWL